MEKLKAHHDLAAIKAAFSVDTALSMSKTARDSAFELGYTLTDIVALVQRISAVNFYKSMTSDKNNKVWQDVYHITDRGVELYVKFTTLFGEYFLISFKIK